MSGTTDIVKSTPDSAVVVLIAEDSPTQAQRLRHTLERHGYRVTSAANGRAALQEARARRPTLIISDIMMPEMDGYQLCRQIKSDPQLRDVPIILVTTLSDPQDVVRGLECGADNFITKPYEETYLLSRIRFMLANDGMHSHDRGEAGVDINLNGQRHLITADRAQILNLLLSTYDAAVQRNQELVRAKDDLRAANSALQATNKELEAFSYSVSHDLRAPLRTIDGFSRSLLEDHADGLDEVARDLLQRSRNACVRMGHLIDDLMKLSQVARSEMCAEETDLSALARSIGVELQKNERGRQVGFHIADGLVASGDPRLLRIVLENLLGNAWKFTARRKEAMIEVGMAQQEAERVFFVRDNGAGFNMAYARNLFGAFQRLHSANDFPGTGVGLATVQRIIHRHGGRIWAEGEVNVGATFYFTL
jgi:hypothetical protein